MKAKKRRAMKLLIESGELTTALLAPLDIPFELFLRLAQLPKEKADRAVMLLIERCKVALEVERIEKKAEKALRAGDIDAAFDTGIAAANVADGIKS